MLPKNISKIELAYLTFIFLLSSFDPKRIIFNDAEANK
jgi:hypothetical protein